MTNLTGKVAIVTGASRGIGRATALALARAGCRVTVNYRSGQPDAEQLAAEIRQLGGAALLARCDVADHEAVERMVAETVAEFGRLDIAVTNACYSDRE